MEKINKNIYIKSTYPDYKNNEDKQVTHFSEIDTVNKGEIRRIVFYSDGIIAVATPDSGFNGEELTHGNVFDDSWEELNDSDQRLRTIKITKEEFESEWQKAISQPNFILKPYSEYTENEWNNLGK